jgi:hypothetical protein
MRLPADRRDRAPIASPGVLSRADVGRCHAQPVPDRRIGRDHDGPLLAESLRSPTREDALAAWFIIVGWDLTNRVTRRANDRVGHYDAA